MKFSPKKFRTARKLKKLTLVELSKLMGVSKAAVGHWETGTHVPPDEKIEDAARFLEVDLGSLFEEGEVASVEDLDPIDLEFARLIAEARGITPRQAVSQALRECVSMSMQERILKKPAETGDIDRKSDPKDGTHGGKV